MALWGGTSAVYGLKLGGRCIVALPEEARAARGAEGDADGGDGSGRPDAGDAGDAAGGGGGGGGLSDSDSEEDGAASSISDASLHHFLLGTCALHAENELHSVEFNEETGEIRARAVWAHPDEVWHLAPCPGAGARLLTTVHQPGATAGAAARKQATLWRFPAQNDAVTSRTVSAQDGGDTSADVLAPRPLERVAAVEDASSSSSSAAAAAAATASVHFTWEASTTTRTEPRGLHTRGDCIQVVTLADGGLAVSSTLSARDVFAPAMSAPPRARLSKAAWDPHHAHEFAAVAGGDIYGYDLRLSKTVHTIYGAHADVVMDLDYNPNKPYCLVSCGDDCMIRFWDLRMASNAVSEVGGGGGGGGGGGVRSDVGRAGGVQAPLRVLRGHSHWVRTVKYNPFHDQLVLSAGSDASSGLWRVSSISSAPLLEMDPEEDDDKDDSDDSDDSDVGSDSDGGGAGRDRTGSRKSSVGSRASRGDKSGGTGEAEDVLIRKSEEHEESVYAVAWSASEAWTYASLSLDGRMVVSHVPSAEKYKILL